MVPVPGTAINDAFWRARPWLAWVVPLVGLLARLALGGGWESLLMLTLTPVMADGTGRRSVGWMVAATVIIMTPLGIFGAAGLASPLGIPSP